MLDPVRTLLLAIEEEVAALPGASLAPAPGAADRATKFADQFGQQPPPGYAGFLARYDGGVIAPELRLFSFEESVEHRRRAGRPAEMKGLWPIMEREGRLLALDAESPGAEAEWPVVELADRSVDRAGTTFLRFLHALLGDLRLPDTDEIARARVRCERDPGHAEHWLDLAYLLERAGKVVEAEQVLHEGLRCAAPPGPALVVALGLAALDRGETGRARAAIDDALALEPLTAHDDDARLDAAAISLVMAIDARDDQRAAKARELLGPAAASTGAYWRGEALRARVSDNPQRAGLALRILELLLPDDADVKRLRSEAGPLLAALRALSKAREALERGAADEAARHARAAITDAPELGVSHAALAEALNVLRERGALDAAKRATELNPALVDAWRELGDAYLEARNAAKSEEAYREVIRRDPTNGIGLAKLAQALLEQGRTLEALETINAAAERGGDPFFLNAVKGDILSEMKRHRDAAEAYELALRIEPEDHWALHQAALEHGRAGDHDRAIELFERAIRNDREGCHQTFVDFGDLMRRIGRIGDAVRLYRKAVAAVPSDPEWRQSLREAERELQQAPN